MAKKNQKKYAQGTDDISFYGALGSAAVKSAVTDAITEKSAETVSRNTQTKKAQSDRLVP